MGNIAACSPPLPPSSPPLPPAAWHTEPDDGLPSSDDDDEFMANGEFVSGQVQQGLFPCVEESVAGPSGPPAWITQGAWACGEGTRWCRATPCMRMPPAFLANPFALALAGHEQPAAAGASASAASAASESAATRCPALASTSGSAHAHAHAPRKKIRQRDETARSRAKQARKRQVCKHICTWGHMHSGPRAPGSAAWAPRVHCSAPPVPIPSTAACGACVQALTELELSLLRKATELRQLEATNESLQRKHKLLERIVELRDHQLAALEQDGPVRGARGTPCVAATGVQEGACSACGRPDSLTRSHTCDAVSWVRACARAGMQACPHAATHAQVGLDPWDTVPPLEPITLDSPGSHVLTGQTIDEDEAQLLHAVDLQAFLAQYKVRAPGPVHGVHRHVSRAAAAPSCCLAAQPERKRAASGPCWPFASWGPASCAPPRAVAAAALRTMLPRLGSSCWQWSVTPATQRQSKASSSTCVR